MTGFKKLLYIYIYIMALNNSFGDFKQFIIDNNIIGTSAGVCVALAAKDAISSFVNDVMLPAIITFLRTLNSDFLTKYLSIGDNAKFKIIDFLKQTTTFILTIIISFIFVKITFGYLLGINIKKK